MRTKINKLYKTNPGFHITWLLLFGVFFADFTNIPSFIFNGSFTLLYDPVGICPLILVLVVSCPIKCLTCLSLFSAKHQADNLIKQWSSLSIKKNRLQERETSGTVFTLHFLCLSFGAVVMQLWLNNRHSGPISPTMFK